MTDGLSETGSLALAAAHQAAIGAAELLRFVSDGHGGSDVFEEEAIEKLADAVKMALEVQAAFASLDAERGQLHAALCRYLEGWAG